MKKCVVFAAAVFVSGLVFAQNGILRFRGAVSNLTTTSEAVTKVQNHILNRITKARDVLPMMILKMSDEEKAEVDAAFAPINGKFINNQLPQCYTNYVNDMFPPSKYPTHNSVVLRTGRCFELKPNMEETIDMFGELVNMPIRSISTFRHWQNWMQQNYFQELKLWFRKNGKSVVEKNGVNPLAPYMDGLMAALNAPRLEGLNQCLETIGIDKKVDLSVLPSTDEINKMREEVLIGNINLTKKWKAAFDLIVCLGVDGYNEMVRQYNGEE